MILGGLLLSIVYRELEQHEFAQAMKIRIQVFVEEQKVPLQEEHDCVDLTARHFGVFLDGACVGTGRLYLQDGIGILGRLAILPEFRGRGLGRGLVQALIIAGQTRGIHEFLLGAQTHALDFYKKLGFRPEGELFLDGGIPHRMMRYKTWEIEEMDR